MSTATAVRQSTRPAESVPPLQAGDRLTRDEFERRYRAMPHAGKAELIEGVVYMPPHVSIEGHSSPHFDLTTVLGVYRSQTPGVQGGDNGTILLDLDNEPQPDTSLRILPQHGGQSRDWFVLRVGAYERLQPAADGVLRSEVFPGLWLDAGALIAGDLARAIAVVQQGLASAEHAEFAARLQRFRA